MLLLGAMIGASYIVSPSLAYDATSTVIAGVEAYNHGSFALAFRLLSQEAESGNSDAEVNLGYLYARGHGVAPNQAKAFRLYQLSAQRGNGEGMNALGYKYQFGTGVQPDIRQAIHWYCLAIEQGNPRAMNNLALILSNGTGVIRDIAQARNLWRQAANRDDINSMFNLGSSLLTEPDDQYHRKAMGWIERAATGGNVFAQRQLRQLGYSGQLPPPRDNALLMKIQPANLPPGHAEICGDLIS